MVHSISNPTGITLVAMYAFLLFASCKKEDIDMVDCTGLTPTYTASVKLILDTSCAVVGCHDAITSQNGINLSTYASAKAISSENRFLGAIQHKSGFEPMPFGGAKLPEATIEILTCWVQNGSPE